MNGRPANTGAFSPVSGSVHHVLHATELAGVIAKSPVRYVISGLYVSDSPNSASVVVVSILPGPIGNTRSYPDGASTRCSVSPSSDTVIFGAVSGSTLGIGLQFSAAPQPV